MRVNEKEQKKIKQILDFIQENTGVILTPCNFFTGIRKFNGEKYFNAILKDGENWISNDFKKLKRFEKKYNRLRFCENGIRRICVFFK